jgi:hypothetical protein
MTWIKSNIFYILGVFDLNQNKYILYFRWRRQYLSIALGKKKPILYLNIDKVSFSIFQIH